MHNDNREYPINISFIDKNNIKERVNCIIHKGYYSNKRDFYYHAINAYLHKIESLLPDIYKGTPLEGKTFDE